MDDSAIINQELLRSYSLPVLAGTVKPLPVFQPPPLPRCAQSGLPKHYELGQKQALRLRRKLKSEEINRLDFHGFAGDAIGFRAFLAHKFGSSGRGWRKAIAPDEAGISPVTLSEFSIALHKIGYTGNATSLWQALRSRSNSTHVGLHDADPRLANALDALTLRISYNCEGGVQKAWKEIDRDLYLRINFDEFSSWVEEKELQPVRGLAVPLREVFEVLDMSERGSLSLEDMRFLDLWAHKRLGKPLHEYQKPDLLESPEPSHWSPPPPKLPKEQEIEDFRDFLDRKYGSAGRAWRIALDIKGCSHLSISSFGEGCRAVGWPDKPALMYTKLKEAGKGVVKLRALDPQLCQAIDMLRDAVSSRYGTFQAMWKELLDPGNAGSVSLTEFVPEVARELELTKKEARMIFMTLDTADTGWVAESELHWLETFEAALPKEEDLVKAQSKTFGGPSAFNPALQLAPGALGKFALPWQVSSEHNKHLGTSISSPMGRQLWAPQKSSRSFQYRALANAHQLKHRWLTSAVEDRCLYVNNDEVVDHQRSSRHALKPDPVKYIFRNTSEFYRSGHQTLLETLPLEED